MDDSSLPAKLQRLRKAADTLGKPSWRPMLRYLASLHERGIHPARPPFAHPWEEIGPGYCYGPAFGHWDIVHAALDTLPWEPNHARHQILNNLAAQQPDGLVPGSIYLAKPTPFFQRDSGHPPLWPIAVDDYTSLTGDTSLRDSCLDPLLRQIRWFEKYRSSTEGGFFYTDILNRTWESGIDEGIRFDSAVNGPHTCIDATSHVCALYGIAARWTRCVRRDASYWEKHYRCLRRLISSRLFSPATGFFHDIWSVHSPSPPLALEGMWPVVLGQATPAQAKAVFSKNLAHPDRFFTPHPLASVARHDPSFELRMWRGPSWNSMTYWAARGAVHYKQFSLAKKLLEGSLDQSARVFSDTGTIWEFYHPFGGDPREVKRKPDTPFNTPCRDYLGHNPLTAMARLYQIVIGDLLH